MRNFCIAEKLNLEDKEKIFDFLVGLIDGKLILDKNQILRDVRLYESVTGGKCAVFGPVSVHTAKTSGIREFCMTGAIFNNRIELMILWDDISEPHLDRLSEIARQLGKIKDSEAPLEEIIVELQKIS